MTRLSYSKVNPNLQLAWDSTSLGVLKECPRKYQLQMIEGYSGKEDNMHLLFGQWFHSALEKYDKLLCDGATHNEALIDVVRFALSQSMRTVFFHECEKCGITLNLKKKHENCPNCSSPFPKVIEHLQPWDSEDKNKNRFNLIRTIVWYLEEFKDNHLKTFILQDGTPAVELSFRLDLHEKAYTGEDLLLCGHLDRLAEMGDQLWIIDRKTSKNTLAYGYFEKYTPDNQMSLYTLGGKVLFSNHIKGVIIDAAQLGVNFSRFERGFADRTDESMEEWVKDVLLWIRQGEAYAKENYWPMNDTACHHYGGCQFRGICSKSPSVRKTFLEGNYSKSFWDPLEVRN